jgi:hypothetical protein
MGLVRGKEREREREKVWAQGSEMEWASVQA